MFKERLLAAVVAKSGAITGGLYALRIFDPWLTKMEWEDGRAGSQAGHLRRVGFFLARLRWRSCLIPSFLTSGAFSQFFALAFSHDVIQLFFTNDTRLLLVGFTIP